MPSGNYLHHCVAVRFRVTGSGEFHSTLTSLDDVYSQPLTDITLSATNERYPNQLANFIQQRYKIEFSIEGIGESFTLQSITFYDKPVATGYPQ
jgi:hypothetical protein